MLAAENSTLERIQREIKDVMEREKELKNYQSNVVNNNNNEEGSVANGLPMNGVADGGKEKERPPFVRAQSTSALFMNGHQVKSNGNIRRFTANPNNVKGVMQRFIKSRGRINPVGIEQKQKQAPAWTPADFTAAKIPADQTKYARNGFVPVEERLRKEIQEEQDREFELRTQRRRSQPTFESFSLEEPGTRKPPGFALRATKSMAQLYDSCDDLATEAVPSPPASLKAAKSLAELCDVGEDEVQTPQTLIQRFERMIIKNKSAKRA